jgi:hypothetical protein
MRTSAPTTSPRGGLVRSMLLALASFAASLVTTDIADARPGYFEQLKSHYAIAEGSNLDACGVCHFRWSGTGSRNPYGSTVEQQLYLGKNILQSLIAVEAMDPDEDGYTSGDELINFMTLPGYNCDNFISASGAPTGYDTYITPNVDTCLDPLDIRTSPSTVSALVNVGDVRVMQLTVFNNGSEDPLEISSYELLAGAPATLSITSGPAVPLTIPVGLSEVIELTFAPTGPVFSNSTLRIVSNDPDEGVLDVPVTVFAVPDNTAPSSQRRPCFETIAKATSRYAKAQLRSWGDCQLAELAGRACDTGARDLKLAKAAAKLASVIGGEKDKTCSAAGLSAPALGFPSTCAPGCEDVSVSTVADIPSCLICMQDLVMQGILREGTGTAPPDLPPNVLTVDDTLSCQQRIVRGMQKGLVKMFDQLSQCELTALETGEPAGNCATDLTETLSDLRSSIDANVDKCTTTTDLLGCRFEDVSPDPACLGLATEELAVELTNAAFALYE